MSVHRGTVLIMLWGYYFDKKIQDSEEYNVSPHVKLEIGGVLLSEGHIYYS